MKKIILLFLMFSFLFLVFFVFAQALEVELPPVPGAPLPEEPTLPEYTKYLYNLSIIIAGIVALFSLVYGGFRYLISAGQPSSMADARDQITAGIVGLILLLGSYLFLTIINPQLRFLKVTKIPVGIGVILYDSSGCPGERIPQGTEGENFVYFRKSSSSLGDFNNKARSIYFFQPGQDSENPGNEVKVYIYPQEDWKPAANPSWQSIDHDARQCKEISPGTESKSIALVWGREAQLTTAISGAYEIPIGTLIERALEPGRLNFIKNKAEDIRRASERVKNKAEELRLLIADCNNCSLTYPVPSVCPGLLCIPEPQCQGEPCPTRNAIIQTKADLNALAGALAGEMEQMLGPLTSLRRDTQRLQFGAALLKLAIYPINYDNFLEIKQVIMEAGGDVHVVPFFALGETIRAPGDAANFYVDAERIDELFAIGQFPILPPESPIGNVSSDCSGCEIDLRFTSAELTALLGAKKEEFASTYPEGRITASCPDGSPCWDYVINRANNRGWNPAFLLALWGTESSFSSPGGIALGCDPHRINEGTSPYNAGIVRQLDCFFDTTEQPDGYCRIGNNCKNPNNTDLCAFGKCWNGDFTFCTFRDQEWFPTFFDVYMRLVPLTGEGPDLGGAVPSGSCTEAPPSPPPSGGVAGCPLRPGTFNLNCHFGWRYLTGDRLRPHTGIDLSGNGDPVFAIRNGQVTVHCQGGEPTCPSGYGRYIILHTDIGAFLYGHLQHNILVSNGEIVDAGKPLGFVGGTGGYVPHLHLGFTPSGETRYSPSECLGFQCINDAPPNQGRDCRAMTNYHPNFQDPGFCNLRCSGSTCNMGP